MKLEPSKLQGDEKLQWPCLDNAITVDSAATEVFVDFRRNRPLVIESSVGAYRTQQFMQKAHVKFKLVIDAEKALLGVLSLDDFDHIDFRQRVVSVYRREPLTVAEIMQPIETLYALPLEQVKESSIADILYALRQLEERHCLVKDDEDQMIVGYFSSLDIANEIMRNLIVDNCSDFSSLYRAKSTSQ